MPTEPPAASASPRKSPFRWRRWKRRVGWILAFTGLTLSGISVWIYERGRDVVAKAVEDQDKFEVSRKKQKADLDASLEEFEKKLTSARARNREDVETAIHQEALSLVQRSDLMKKLVADTETQIQERLSQWSIGRITETATGLKVLLHERQHPQPGSSLIAASDPRELRNWGYSLDALLASATRLELSQRMTDARRESILLLLNALVDAVRGRTRQAIAWCELAERADNSWPDPLIMQARFRLAVIKIRKSRMVLDTKQQKEAIDMLERAVQMPGAVFSEEAQLQRTILPLIRGEDAKKALRDLDRRIEQLKPASAADEEPAIQPANRSFPATEPATTLIDPRYYLYKAAALQRVAVEYGRKAGDDSDRLEAQRQQREATQFAFMAFQEDTELLSALNNCVWYASHLPDGNDSIADLSKLPDGEAAQLNLLLEFLAKDQQVLILRHPELLNTVCHGYAALSRHPKYANQGDGASRPSSTDAAKLSDDYGIQSVNVAELFSAQEDLDHYRESARKAHAFVKHANVDDHPWETYSIFGASGGNGRRRLFFSSQ